MSPELPSITVCCKLNTENPIWRTILAIGKYAFRNHSMQPPHQHKELRPRLPASLGSEFPTPYVISGSYDHNTDSREHHTNLPSKGNSENHRKPLTNTSSLVTHSIPLLCSHQTVNLPLQKSKVKCFFLDVHYFHKQEGEKNKKMNIDETVQIDHFSNELGSPQSLKKC